MTKLKVGIAGYGVVGKRRHEFIDQHPNMKVVAVCDQSFTDEKKNNSGISVHRHYKSLLEENIDVLFVCLTNDISAKVTMAGLKKNMHVFCEKPPGRDVDDIKKVIDVEMEHPWLKLKYGFNHRYHDSIKMALEMINSNEFGSVINLRGVYGKSKIIPFTGGWRSKREIAGGGILLDQGIHMVDLMRLFCGEFDEVKSFISNDYWKHNVEDNAYAIMKDKHGRVAMLNSTATQWQHKFSLEITLTEGYIDLTGILSGSKSYGEERIVFGKRNDESDNGQMASTTYKFLHDNSWKEEIFEFADSILKDRAIESGNSLDALETMKLVYKIYYNDEKWRNDYNIKNP